MRRLLSGFSAILLLFSCSPHISVHQINTMNILIDSQTSSVDSSIQTIISPFHDSIEHDMSKLVAVSATSLVKGKPESRLTNLVADILLESGIEYCSSQNLNIKDIASYVNYGGLRASFPKGEITMGRIFELMPFENEVVLINISGDAIRQMAERIASRGGEGIAGMTLGIRNEKLGSLTIGGKAVESTSSYWVVTNDYIANGGDQMSMLLKPLQRIDTKLKLRDILVQGLSSLYKNNGDIDVKLDGRIYNEQ
jgi:2',3'-cyclic-nucleotide 2'-phosphodiesterase (5'-nucleotidase family)